MIKTTYQTPEIRNANDEIVQEGAFGKNTALSNSTNDGWIDYVVNNLEALHDTIGDSAPTLDGNGHVVEPANLAIGDEDGLRIKNNYLKLSGGKVTGIASFRTDLRMLDNQDNRFGGLYVPASSATEQYLQLYGGTRATGDARLTLYPSGDGHFQLLAYSNDGSNSYALQSDNAGNLNWRGYPLAWKKDYLPLAGGTMTGLVNFGQNLCVFTKYEHSSSISIVGSSTDSGIGILSKRSSFSDSNLILRSGDQTGTPSFTLTAGNGSTSKAIVGKPDGTLTWGGNSIALAKDVLPLTGGTMTGMITAGTTDVLKSSANDSRVVLMGGTGYSSSASLILRGGNASSNAGGFELRSQDGSATTTLVGKTDGTLTWGNNQLGLQKNTNNYVQFSNGQSYTFTFTSNMVTIIARRGGNCAMYVVDVWDTGAVKLAGTGNEPISVGHEVNSHECTITNINGNAIVVQIIHSDIGW